MSSSEGRNIRMSLSLTISLALLLVVWYIVENHTPQLVAQNDISVWRNYSFGRQQQSAQSGLIPKMQNIKSHFSNSFRAIPNSFL
jgi:hypothetical protein